MNELVGQPGVLTMTINVTRKATGKVETYELIGTPLPIPEEPKEPELGGNSLDRSS